MEDPEAERRVNEQLRSVERGYIVVAVIGAITLLNILLWWS